MAEKFLKFSVCEQTGRTFEIPYDLAIEIIKNHSKEAEPTTWSELEIAEELYNFYSDHLEGHEKENCYYESWVQDAEVE